MNVNARNATPEQISLLHTVGGYLDLRDTNITQLPENLKRRRLPQPHRHQHRTTARQPERRRLPRPPRHQHHATARERTDWTPVPAETSTVDGRYYLAQLLSEGHLKEESAFLEHCLGGGSLKYYLPRIKRGAIEIFSVRNSQTHEPIVTIEYDVRSKSIQQVKGRNNHVLSADNLSVGGDLYLSRSNITQLPEIFVLAATSTSPTPTSHNCPRT